MKKAIVCLFAAFAAYVTFAGYAWFSSEINAILVSADFPSKYRTLESPVKLYGSFSESYWTPPYAKVSYVSGEVTMENETTINVTTFADLNNYGKYDPSVSLGHYKDNCKQYVVDEFGQQYAYFDENVAAFYTKYESMNMNAAVNAFDQLKTKFQLWISSIRSQTGGLTYDASALAEKVKEINNALDKASSQIANTAKEVEQRVADFNQSIQEAQQHLANVANTQIENAQDLINGCVSDFSSFITILEDALESGEGWKEGAANAYSKITESEQKILDAIEALQPYSPEPEVAQALVVLNQQKNTIAGLRSGLHAAITNPDEEAGKAAAQGILNSAKQVGLIDSKKAMKRIDNAAKTYQSQQRMLNTLQKAAIGTIDYVNMIEAEINSLREEFDQHVINTMDNFHEIGAFLCSTNSMEYLDWRKTKKSISDMSVSDVKKWFAVTMQDPLFRDAGDAATYETIGRLGKMGGTYNNIFRLIGSTYFLTYMDLEWMDRFMHTYDQGSFKKENIRGFYAEEENEGGNTVTNWYAGHITAPKNWADGTSIVVTNGQLKAVASVLDHQSVTTNEAGAVEVYGFSSNTTEVGMVPYKKGENELGWKYVGIVDCITISTNETEHADEAAIKGFYEPETENGMVPYKKSATELGWKNVGGADADNSSVTTNTAYGAVEQGKVSIYGFSSAPTSGTSQMSIPVKMANGKIEWKPLYTMTVVTRSNYSTVSHKFENFTRTFYVVADSEPGESSEGVEVFTAVECPSEP